MKYDVFLSHASEDKDSFVRNLSAVLKQFGVRVWYDEFSLKIGDSLSRSIDKGLSESNYGLVVLSKHFLKKDWTDYELRGLLAKELGKNKVVLPIWHDISRDDVLKFSPTLADKLALATNGLLPSQIAVKIIEVIRPDLFEKIMRRAVYISHKNNSKVSLVEVEKIKFGPPKHKDLPFNLISRVRLIRASLLEVYPHSMQYWIDGFRGDAHPSREIRIWEHISSCYLEFTAMTRLTHEQRKTTYSILTALSCGAENQDKLDKEFLELPDDSKEKLLNLWNLAVPAYDVKDEEFPLDYCATKEDIESLKSTDLESFPHDFPDELVFDLLSQSPLEDA